MQSPELAKVLEAAWNKGFAFGKYTQDVPLTLDVIELLENSNELMKEYMLEFRKAVASGMLETLRN